jgi:oxygen-independent coproporphyrinogen-3 oxidase
MAGIYLHIPFCKQACHYCNFHFSTTFKYKNDFVSALLKEISIQQEYLAGEPVETVYFGGGTPSLLTRDDLDRIFAKLRDTFQIHTDAEITLEANPDDITPEKAMEWKSAGINRLSIGIQSFFDADLRWMNRAHDAVQSLKSIRAALDAGLENLSIDFIYGTPTMGDDHWKSNIDQAIALNIPHLSCYALTVEPSTALQKMIGEKKKENINPADQARQFLLLMDRLRAAGYEQYEISNFAKPLYRSRHNSSYWQGKKYLGLGPSAHSFNGNERQWNIANNALYMQSLQKQTVRAEKEELTELQKLNEYIMTSLRTIEGCSLEKIFEKFGARPVETLMQASLKWKERSYLLLSDASIILTDPGKLFADGIAADLFFENL